MPFLEQIIAGLVVALIVGTNYLAVAKVLPCGNSR